ncbi:MAG TPA: hypothetical protein VF753_07700 [Terriglobales bacterium]
MIGPRLFMCSGAEIAPDDPVAVGRRIVPLNSIGLNANVHIRFENVARVFGRQLTPRLVDLLEIASYVFSADCATRRGTEWSDNHSTEPWSRDFAFVIPVRDLAFWSSEAIQSLMVDLLTFLADDRYSFTFVPLNCERPFQQQYFDFGGFKDWPFYSPDRVIMFSGGLDSLVGAVETGTRGHNSVLVSHRPVSTMSARQGKLFRELEKSFPRQFLHVPVWINKNLRLGQEPTQRTRSFLFAALGTVVGESINAGGVRFFENGVVSLNLPVADEVLRSRASRTTHPIALHLLQLLCTAVVNREFIVDNPYFYRTKTEVVEVLPSLGFPHLIAHTCSCAHSMFKSKSRWHCGKCSQCIDRRFAVTAAGLEKYDPKDDYESDVFVGARCDGPEKNMAADYVRHGSELCQRAEKDLMSQFSVEISRAVRYQVKRNESAGQIVRMHKRHGNAVGRAIERVIAERAGDLAKGLLEPTSLLAMFISKEHLKSAASSVSVGNNESATRSPGGLSLSEVEKVVRVVLSEIGAPTRKKITSRNKPNRRNIVIYAAIVLKRKGLQYCEYLDTHGVKPKWQESGPTTYRKSYDAGNAWRKRVQDEKSRSRTRFETCPESELRTALIKHLPDEFEVIVRELNSRNSRSASSIFYQSIHA